MKILVDTQVFIWSIVNSNKLSIKIKNLLQNNEILVCDISLMEIAIKQKIGKLSELTLSIDALVNQAKSDNYIFLKITSNHISKYNDIPLFENHRDPFDRLIIATALSENIAVISADEKFKLYDSLITLIEA
jgi:PIN domain nuclease of toxin-antitoxin system